MSRLFGKTLHMVILYQLVQLSISDQPFFSRGCARYHVLFGFVLNDFTKTFSLPTRSLVQDPLASLCKARVTPLAVKLAIINVQKVVRFSQWSSLRTLMKVWLTLRNRCTLVTFRHQNTLLVQEKIMVWIKITMLLTKEINLYVCNHTRCEPRSPGWRSCTIPTSFIGGLFLLVKATLLTFITLLWRQWVLIKCPCVMTLCFYRTVWEKVWAWD